MGSQGTSDVRPIILDTHHPFMSQHVWQLYQPGSRRATAPRAELQNPGFALCIPESGGSSEDDWPTLPGSYRPTLDEPGVDPGGRLRGPEGKRQRADRRLGKGLQGVGWEGRCVCEVGDGGLRP